MQHIEDFAVYIIILLIEVCGRFVLPARQVFYRPHLDKSSFSKNRFLVYWNDLKIENYFLNKYISRRGGPTQGGPTCTHSGWSLCQSATGVNRIQQFSFSRLFHRGQRDSDNAFSSLWLERAILTTSHQLPGILRWCEVFQVFELSPLQTAIETMEQTADGTHPGSPSRSSVAVAAVNGGINNYEKAFFTDRYLVDHPENARLVSQLQELFALQIPLLEAALVVHRSRVNVVRIVFFSRTSRGQPKLQKIFFPSGQAMQPLQQRIKMCFHLIGSNSLSEQLAIIARILFRT